MFAYILRPMSVENPLEELRRRLCLLPRWSQRSVVVVTGSGVSIQATRSLAGATAKAASWRGLLEMGLAHCEKLKRKPRSFNIDSFHAGLSGGQIRDLLEVATAVEDLLRRTGSIQGFLHDSVGALRPMDIDLYTALAQLGVPLATTNYDGLIEFAMPPLQALTWTHAQAGHEWFEGKQPGVLHLHGHFREVDSVVLGRQSYDEVVKDGHAQNILRNLFQQRTLLFVGMGGALEDPNFEKLLDWALAARLPTDCFHVLAVREGESHEARLKWPLTTGIRVVSYGPDYSDLGPFLRSLLPPSRRSKRPPPGSGSQGPPTRTNSQGQGNPPAQRRALRQRLSTELRRTADFDAFVLDFFPAVFQQYTRGMNRPEQENLLLADEAVLFEVQTRLDELSGQFPSPAIVPTAQDPRHTLAPTASPEFSPTLQARAARTERDERPPGKRRAAWSALLRLDRFEQYGWLLGSQQSHPINQLVLIHGRPEQNVALFVQRIEEYFRDDARSELITVPMVRDGSRAVRGTTWGVHMKYALEDHLGERETRLEELLALATNQTPLLVSLVGSENPLHVLSDLSREQRHGLREFLTQVLPERLREITRVTVLLPIEHTHTDTGGGQATLLAEIIEWAQTAWHSEDRTFTALPELKMPSWDDVEHYLRGYRPPLPNLVDILAETKQLHTQLRDRPGATFEQLARRLDQIVLKHGHG